MASANITGEAVATEAQIPAMTSAEAGEAEQLRATHLAAAWRMPLLNLNEVVVQPDALQALPEELVRKLNCLPIRKDLPGEDTRVRRATLLVAISDPSDLAVVDQIEFASGCRLKMAIGTATEIKAAIDRHYSPER
jgi:hypothetical protein